MFVLEMFPLAHQLIMSSGTNQTMDLIKCNFLCFMLKGLEMKFALETTKVVFSQLKQIGGRLFSLLR